MQARVGVLAVTVLVSAACGDIQEVASDAAPPAVDAAPPDAAPPPGACDPGGDPTLDEGYECLTHAGCSLISRCLPIITVEDCVLMDIRLFDVRAFIHRALVREATEEGAIVFHSDELAACYTTLTEMSCADLFEHEGFDEISIERICPAVFTGTVPMDGTCFTALDCDTPGSVCRFSPDCTSADFCCPGTCIVPAALDASCDGPPCAPGDHCVGGICRSGEASAPCSGAEDCDVGLWCNDGSCAAELESGASCTQLEQCPGPEICLFAPGAKSGTCARIDEVDAACNESCYGFVCVQPEPTELGTCEALLSEEGADCSELPCTQAFECSEATGQCDPRGEVGELCSSAEGFRCRGGPSDGGLFCDNEISGEETGVCSAPLADGESCTSNDQCQSGVCRGEPQTCQPYPGCYE